MRDATDRHPETFLDDGLTTTTHQRIPVAAEFAAAAGRREFLEPCHPTYKETPMSLTTHDHTSGHHVREFVCSYRTLRDDQGEAVQLPDVPLKDPKAAAHTLAPLLAGASVEIFAVACLSAKHTLLTWHLLSRGTRHSASVSLPDVFVPACLTPGATAVLVVHNHPSGDPTPSHDDALLTIRLAQAADVLDIPLLDHLIVGEAGRYYSFREAGILAEKRDGDHS